MTEANKAFKKYFIEEDNKEKNFRTMEVEDTLLAFYEDAAPYYNSNTTTIINNILREWIDTHHYDIKKDIISKIGNVKIKHNG
ncbi:MAG: hypothetical protein RLO81_07860 [Fulvivirga sp.]|uniref:hypothetical protein n=1 Tax=Fulvivirga sp. TaxID=1931237 RepID=UPI0032EE2DFE